MVASYGSIIKIMSMVKIPPDYIHKLLMFVSITFVF